MRADAVSRTVPAAGAVRLSAPAKINLCLGVHSKLDERGYHRVDSVMAPLTLADLVSVVPSGRTGVQCDPPAGCPTEKNTCWKAIHELSRAVGTPVGFSVRVGRAIPDQAGLGGSSSDAAATILGVCRLCGIDPGDPRVADAARAVGADVPFFLVGGACFLDGAGDVVREALPVPSMPDGSPVPVALVRPMGPGVSTPSAYRDFDRAPVRAPSPEPMLAALRRGDAAAVAHAVGNNLEDVACRLLPLVSDVLCWMRASGGVMAAQVSGSGSCCFALCESAAAARRVAAGAADRGWWSCATSLRADGAALLG